MQLVTQPVQWLWNHRFPALNLVGLGMLGWYCSRYGVELKLVWAGVFLVVALSIAVFSVLVVNPLLDRIAPSQVNDITAAGEGIYQGYRFHPLRTLAKTPGEDGLFFVPLLLIGVTPLTSAVGGLLFGAMHYPAYPLKYCIPKALIFFSAALLVLPNGLLTVVVGHILLDVVAFVGWHFARAR